MTIAILKRIPLLAPLMLAITPSTGSAYQSPTIPFRTGAPSPAGTTSATQKSPKADRVIRNAKILQWSGPSAEALAISGDRIVWVGSDADAANWISTATEVLDARSATVSPGFNDAHVHFLSGSLSYRQVQLADAMTRIEILQRISDYVAKEKDAPVIVGRGWLYGAFEEGLPHRRMLDAIVDNRPVLMRSYDGHTIWVNSVALRLANIHSQTPDPDRGQIVRDPKTGEPTGVLKESAQRLVDALFPEPSHEEKCQAVGEGIRTAHRFGITSIQECGVDAMELAVFESLHQEGTLQLRMHTALSGHAGMQDHEFDQMSSMRATYPHLGVKSVKLFVDGVIESHTAFLLSPYANQATVGLPSFTSQELQRVIDRLDRDGWDVMVHATGEGGVRRVLDAYEHAIHTNTDRKRTRRHRVEHAETIAESDLERFGKLGVIASMQPMHAEPNSNIYQVWIANLGEERANRAWAWKSISQLRGVVAFGTDWPVVGLDPRPGLQVAMTRQTLQGKPPGGFLPQQRLTLEEAIYAYTYAAAFAEGREEEKGSLEVGKLADLVVWEQDLSQLSQDKIQTAPIAATLFGGRIVYRKE